MNKPFEVDFRVLFESAPSLLLILHPDLTIAAASDAYLKATMTSRDEIVGKNLFTVFPDNPDDIAANGTSVLRESLNFVTSNKSQHTMAVQKYDIRRPDGAFEERFWSIVNKPVCGRDDEILYIINKVEDVTEFINLKRRAAREHDERENDAVSKDNQIYQRVKEIQSLNGRLMTEIEQRKIIEENLRMLQILLQCTLESQKEILIFTIDTDYKYLNFNSAFRDATVHAYGTDVRLGMSVFDSISDKTEQEKVKDHCDRAMRGESHVNIDRYGNVHPFYFETRYNPVLNDREEIMGVTVLSTNVTERIRTEEEIKALNKDLEAFSYSVAHDLRAPLRIMDGYSGILVEDYGHLIDDEGRRLLGIIVNNCRHMGQLIDDLLNFSRLGRLSPKSQEVDMEKLVRGVIEEQVTQIPDHRIEFRIGALEPAICDGGLIRVVYSNLISNAIKYSRKKERPLIEIGSERNHSETTYFVKDNGSGFDMKYADKLFNVFQRLHKTSEFEGTGVGLAIVQRIVNKHGGRIWAEAEVGKGASFYFSIPVSKEAIPEIPGIQYEIHGK